jgi:hypothetical protein
VPGAAPRESTRSIFSIVHDSTTWIDGKHVRRRHLDPGNEDDDQLEGDRGQRSDYNRHQHFASLEIKWHHDSCVYMGYLRFWMGQVQRMVSSEVKDMYIVSVLAI